MIFRPLIALFSVVLLLACEGSSGGEFKGAEEVSIAHLKSLCRGDHHRITENISIRGVVVATDWLGELNKSAVIVDETGGLEFAIESHNISELLPINSEVTILCNGLMLARIGGSIKLGAPPTGDFPLDNIDDELFARYIRIVEHDKEVRPTTKEIEDIGESDIGNLVRLDHLRLCNEEQGLAWCDTIEGEVVTTFRTFIDREGNTLAIRTLHTCDYALQTMPTNEISVVGVLGYSNNRPFLQIVNKTILNL